MIKILIVDDHRMVRNGIRRILEDESGFVVVAEAEDGEEAVKFCRKEPPDVVLMDVNMPGMGGLEATRQISRIAENISIICLSMQKDDPIPSQVIQLGAKGFLTKDAEPSEMITAIHKVASGQIYLSTEIAQRIAISKISPDNANPFIDLSGRELDIAMRITKGQKVPDIANQLHISAKTVNTYRYRLFDKLSIENDVELTHLALRHKLIPLEQF